MKFEVYQKNSNNNNLI